MRAVRVCKCPAVDAVVLVAGKRLFQQLGLNASFCRRLVVYGFVAVMVFIPNRDLLIVERGIDDLFNLDTVGAILRSRIAREHGGFCFPSSGDRNLRDFDT